MENQTTTSAGNCNGPNCVGDCKTQIMMPCDVCVSVHGDTSVKLCFYCKVCEAYICCKKCRYDMVNRAKAFAIKLEKRAAEAISSVAETVKEMFTGKPDEKTETTNRRNRKHSKPDEVSGRV